MSLPLPSSLLELISVHFRHNTLSNRSLLVRGSHAPCRRVWCNDVLRRHAHALALKPAPDTREMRARLPTSLPHHPLFDKMFPDDEYGLIGTPVLNSQTAGCVRHPMVSAWGPAMLDFGFVFFLLLSSLASNLATRQRRHSGA